MTDEHDLWERTIRPALSGIRYDSYWVKKYCLNIENKVNQLPYRPEFETEAQAEIDAAIKAVTEAGECLQQARLSYLAKPMK